MRPRSAPQSPFGELLAEFCERAGTTPYHVGQQIGIKSRAHISYAMRPQRTGKRHALLTVEQIQQIARLLHCNHSETFRLLILGALEYAPALIGTYVERLEKDLADALISQGKPVPHYRFDTEIFGAVRDSGS